MVKHQREISDVFAALADPTRRRILMLLSNGKESSVGALAKPFRISAPAISRHLRVIEKARLIDRRRQGRIHYVRARPVGLVPAQNWISQCAGAWTSSFDKLDALIAKELGKETRK